MVGSQPLDEEVLGAVVLEHEEAVVPLVHVDDSAQQLLAGELAALDV